MSICEKKAVTLVEDASKKNILSLRCGDCMHFKGNAHPAYGKPCAELGIKTYATAPNCYAPDVASFRRVSANTFMALATILSSFTPQQSRVLLGLLRSVGSLEKYELTFLEKIYLRAGEDYLDNYVGGVVLGVGFQKSIAVVGTTFFSEVKSQVVAYVLPDSIMKAQSFTKKKAALIREGRIFTPRRPHKNDISNPKDYEPPTMETPPEALEQAARAMFKKNKAKRESTAVQVSKRGSLKINLKKDVEEDSE
jgi:hypothetical protein